MTTDTDDVARHADQLYAARSALAEAKPPTRRFGVAEIVRFLSDPSHSLSPEEQRALFTNPRLRADYRRVKTQVTSFELPALAAASSGAVTSRRFEGGSVNIHPSRVPGQIYVILRFAASADAPRMMLLESTAGDLVKRTLPAANQQGEVMMVLSEHSEADAGFLRLLGDPTATGSFVL
ncbi:MAG TPA: hypothetical protein VGG01_12325 [Xanthobacteraceae bacterium]